MNKRDYLSEFEQLAMLAVVQLGDDAYGAKIRAILDDTARRKVSIANIYVALGRLEKRGLVRSWMSDPVAVRGGRSKRLYNLEAAGVEALDQARATHERMWAQAEAAKDVGR